MSASKKSMTDSGRSTSDQSGWVAYMKRRAGSWITSAEQLAERVGITRACVTNQLITKCHLSSELFTCHAMDARSRRDGTLLTPASRPRCRPWQEAEREHQRTEPEAAPNEPRCRPTERYSPLQDCGLRCLGIIEHLDDPTGMVCAVDRFPIPVEQFLISKGDSSASMRFTRIAGVWQRGARTRHPVAVSRPDPAADSHWPAIGAAEIEKRTLDRRPERCAAGLPEVRVVSVSEIEPKRDGCCTNNSRQPE